MTTSRALGDSLAPVVSVADKEAHASSPSWQPARGSVGGIDTHGAGDMGWCLESSSYHLC